MKKWINSNITEKRVSLEDKMTFLVENYNKVIISKVEMSTERKQYMVSVNLNNETTHILFSKTINIGISKLYKKLK